MLRSLMIAVTGGTVLLATVATLVLLVSLEPAATSAILAALILGTVLLAVGGIGFARTNRNRSRTQATAISNLQRRVSLIESELATHELRAAEQQREHANRVAALQTRMMDRLERVSGLNTSTPHVHR